MLWLKLLLSLIYPSFCPEWNTFNIQTLQFFSLQAPLPTMADLMKSCVCEMTVLIRTINSGHFLSGLSNNICHQAAQWAKLLSDTSEEAPPTSALSCSQHTHLSTDKHPFVVSIFLPQGCAIPQSAKLNFVSAIRSPYRRCGYEKHESEKNLGRYSLCFYYT